MFSLLGEVIQYIFCPLFVIGKILFQYIWEKQEFHNNKKEYELNADDQPEFFANTHVFKTLYIKQSDVFKYGDDVHDRGLHENVYLHGVQ